MVYLSMLIALEDDRVFREALDLCGTQLGVEFFSFRYSKEEMKSLRAQLRSLSGHPMSFHGPMHTAELSEKKDSRQLQESFEAYRRALSLAQEVGAKYMVVHTHECFVRPDEKQERMKRSEENIWNLAQLARTYGIRLAIENVSLPNKGVPLYNEEEYIALIHRLPMCAALIDLGHVHCTGWCLEHLCEALRGRIAGFHLHNNNGMEDQHNWIHEGTMDIRRMMKIIRSSGEEPDLILEYGDTHGKNTSDLLDDLNSL